MGKRKFEKSNKGTAKKSKKSDGNVEKEEQSSSAEQPQNHVENEEHYSQEAENASETIFDVKYFRKQLAGKQAQTMVLTQFLQVCLNPDNKVDYMMQYLKIGGNSHEILRQVSNDNKKNLTLATPAFHLFHLIIIKVQSSLPHMMSVTEEACRYFLNTFMPTVEIMISENSGPRHRKIILKLLTSMVTLNPDLGIEVLSQAPLTPKHLQYIVEKANYKEKDNVRTAFVHFMTSFLVDGHLPLVKALLEKQGLLALVIPGLIQDDAEAVLIFLNILKKNVIENSFISKSLKLKTFSHQVLHNLFKLYSWKGPSEMSHADRNELKPEIMSLLSEIILILFTSHKLGLYFVDNTLGTTDSNKNLNLYKAILTLKRPWENEDECRVVLQIVEKCPDLHRAIIHIIEQSFEPQHSPIWERTTDFVIKLIATLKPDNMLPKMKNLNAIQTANFIRFINLPVPLLRNIQIYLNKDKMLALYCVKALVKLLENLKSYVKILEMEDSSHNINELKNRLDYFFPKHLPTPAAIVSLIQNIVDRKNNENTQENTDYTLPRISDTEGLVYLLDTLLLYNDIHPVLFETLEGNLDMKKVLEFSNTLTDNQVSVLKLKIISLWIILDGSAVSLKNPMFKQLFLIMLEVYTSDEGDTWVDAKDILHTFLKNTSIFDGDDDEIDLMLYTLRNTKVNPPAVIGDIVEYVLENIIDLTDYIRNQIVHFEIKDRNSEMNLDNLFNDLMEDKNVESCVFLQSKVPSPFIVGCVQYIQHNKDSKKSLKHFLSLYVANLLHTNYSPELTEVLIGDCKLDVRNYVASWIGEPVALPDNVAGKDEILKNMSEAIINNENVGIVDVFSFLEEATEEEGLIVVNGVSYKVIHNKEVDSSELLTWSKYLVYTIVRLTNLKMLKEVQCELVTQYFNVIIAVGKRFQMLNQCRNIMLILLKNAQFLEIYKAVDKEKNVVNVLATKFLLDILLEHSNIVTYLNQKHNLLKPYRKKNYNEIVKAFIKMSKKKSFHSEHTVNVIEIVGMDNVDDISILNQIYNCDKSLCVKDDKEPSLPLEILRILIEKYSISTKLDLPSKEIKKIMKFYTELLTDKQITPNLTNIEIALAEYFENKPYQVKSVNEEYFKRFFQANIIRKSTASFAAVLLKYCLKFCTTFKKESARPEILTHRELTLPLANATVHHQKFLSDNKEFLNAIYNEYKGNIFKVLEKPHKAGQVYISCWEFVRKLLIECTDLEDCVKMFTKAHKFESVQASHIHMLQALFLKLCTFTEGCKREYLINYFMTMLNSMQTLLKDGQDTQTLNTVVNYVFHVIDIAKSEQSFDVQQKDSFETISKSATWQNFCKAVLKDSLKVRKIHEENTIGHKLLSLLTSFVQMSYPENHEDIVTLFEMVTSHSEFLNIMLSHHSSDIKSRLIEFLYALITKNKSVMKTQQIPVYLSAYHATKSPCDRIILSILNFYEINELPVNEYKPYVWGDSAANFYSVRKNRSASLWSHPTSNQVLNLFEKDIIERTVKHFPVSQKLDYSYKLPPVDSPDSEICYNGSVKTLISKVASDNFSKAISMKDTESFIRNLGIKAKYDTVMLELKDSDLTYHSQAEEDERVYDPAFLLPLLGHLLAPGSVASCFKLLRTGLLSVPVVALSSECSLMRAAAYHVLHRFCLMLDTETRHKNDKLFLSDFIDTLKHSLTSGLTNGEKGNGFGDLKIPRLPAIDALYLARALMVSTAPFDPLYKPVNNFFIAKQFVDLTVVPDFLSLFHDSDVESVDRRIWILDIISDGVKTMVDINVIFKTMCLKMIMDFYHSVLSDRKVQERILQVVNSLISVPRAFEILVEGHGLVSWLHAVVRQLKAGHRSLVGHVVDIIKNMLYSLNVNALARHIGARNKNGTNGKTIDVPDLKTNKEVESEILVILYEVLHHADGTEIENILSYVNVYTLFSKRTLKLLDRNQVVSLVKKCHNYITEESVSLLCKSVSGGDAIVLKSKLIKSELLNDEKLYLKESLLRDLQDIVSAYVT